MTEATPEKSAVKIEEVTAVTDELVAAIASLVPQLSSAPPPDARQLAAIVESPATTLLVARDESSRVVGTLTLVVFVIPTAVRAWIEDVVVDSKARHGGVGEALVKEALRRAQESRALTVDLTSRPSREAANRLYERLGFETRATNVYRHQDG